MVTKEQAIKAGECGSDFHYTGKHLCSKVIGPRGGVRVNVTSVRPSGKCQTWKRDTDRFRLPIKYGLYESGEITQDNAGDFHLASECPLLGREEKLNGITADEWGEEQFRFENCQECGKDIEGHDIIPFLGNWFARCKENRP